MNSDFLRCNAIRFVFLCTLHDAFLRLANLRNVTPKIGVASPIEFAGHNPL